MVLMLVPFGNSIVVMRSDACKPHDLRKRRKVLGKLGGGEDLGVISQVFLWYDTVLTTGTFKLLFCFQGLMRVEIDLKFNMNETS